MNEPVFIQNKGITQTIIQDNKHPYPQIHQLDWNADYDGEQANINIHSNNDGENKHIRVNLDKDDLVQLLNQESVQIPLHKRLYSDFQMQPHKHSRTHKRKYKYKYKYKYRTTRHKKKHKHTHKRRL